MNRPLVLLVAAIILTVAPGYGQEAIQSVELPADPAEALEEAFLPTWSELEIWRWQWSAGETAIADAMTLHFGEDFRESEVTRHLWEVARLPTAIRTIPEPYLAPDRMGDLRAGVQPRLGRYWRNPSELPPAPADQPLHGLRIALDPGHIGGEFADLEGRHFQLGDDPPFREGEWILDLAHKLKPRLEDLGAEVFLTRATNEPVTDLRPEDILPRLRAEMLAAEGGAELKRRADHWFIRVAEIRARALLVNRTIQPDLVLCLHVNADAWPGDPPRQELVPNNHAHFIVNGAYLSFEIEQDKQQRAVFRRIVEGTHLAERSLAEALTHAFLQHNDSPPFTYSGRNARAVGDTGYVWARNLAANRLFFAPTIFLEPYVANSEEDYARILAGDYEGYREVAGEERLSLAEEYTRFVVDGLIRWFQAEQASATH